MQIIKAKKIYTMDNDLTVATGMVVDAGKIIEVGEFEELITKYDCDVNQEYSDQFIFPGFIEPHSHIMGPCLLLGATTLIDYKTWDCGKYGLFEACLTRDEMLSRLKHTFETEDKELYAFFGYHKEYHGELNRNSLDTLMKDKPVVIIFGTGHGAIMNTLGMEKFGFDQRDKTICGVGLDSNNDYTGVFCEQAFIPYMQGVLGALLSQEALIEGARKYLEHSKIHGTVAFSEYAGGAAAPIEKEIPFYQQLIKEEYPVQISYLIDYQSALQSQKFDEDKTFDYVKKLIKENQSEHFSVMNALKFFYDGAVIDHQIKLSEPLTNGHSDDWNYKFGEHNINTFVKDVERYWKDGFDFYVHSQGDESQLKWAEHIKELNDLHKREDYIASIQHFAFSNTEFFDYVKNNGLKMQISALPRYVDVWPMWKSVGLYPEKFLKEEFLRLKDVLNEANHFELSFHNDAQNNPTIPLYAVYKAVTRQPVDGDAIADGQNVDIISALKAITINAAKQNRIDSFLGSLVPEKRASFVVLDKDIVEENPEVLKDLKVAHLIMEGKSVF